MQLERIWSNVTVQPPQLDNIIASSQAGVLRPYAFFVSWQGVLTLAYKGWNPALRTLKHNINEVLLSLPKENPGVASMAVHAYQSWKLQHMSFMIAQSQCMHTMLLQNMTDKAYHTTPSISARILNKACMSFHVACIRVLCKHLHIRPCTTPSAA